MADYQVNGQQILAAAVTDAPQFAKFFVDFIDQQTNLGAFEPIEELAKIQVSTYLAEFVEQAQTAIKGFTLTLEE
jgi:hypothetical protein